MATTAFDRAWSLANANRRYSLSILLLGFLATIPMLFALLSIAATVDLLATQGTLVAPVDEQVAIATSLNQQPDEVGTNWVVYRNSGLLPLAWRARESFAGPLLSNIYRNIGVLRHNYAALFTLLILSAAGFAAYFVMHFLLNWSISAAAQTTGSQLRTALHRQLMHLGACDLPGPLEPSPRELFTSKVDTIVAALVRRGSIVVSMLTMSLVLLAAALLTNVWITLAGLLTAVLVWWLLHLLSLRVAYRKELLHRDRAAQTMNTLLEDLNRTPLVLGYGLRESAGDSFERRLSIYERAALASDTSRIQFFPLVALVFLGGAFLLVALTGMNILRATPQLSMASAVFLGLTITAGLWPLLRITRATQRLLGAQRAARDVYMYLDREPAVIESTTTKKLATIQQGITFEKVAIRDRAGTTVVDELNLSLSPGCHLAVLSTDDRVAASVACLLPRFRDPCQGRVLIDGTDLRQFSLESIRQQIALVVQRGLLFTGTVRENITCGDPRFGLPQASEAARQAQVYNLIQHLPNGFETVIGQHGVSLDPWDAFRIGLARAVLRNPSVYVIEEPSAELDAPTSELMEHCLGMLTEGRIAVMIPTRLSTLRDADRVALIHESRLVDQGTHAELLHRSDLYRHLLYLKFNTYRSGL